MNIMFLPYSKTSVYISWWSSFSFRRLQDFSSLQTVLKKRCNAWIQTDTPCELVHFCGDVKKEKCTY